jgi:hypothetical protein
MLLGTHWLAFLASRTKTSLLQRERAAAAARILLGSQVFFLFKTQ